MNIKQTLLLAIVVIIITSCEDDNSKYSIKIYDECEYISIYGTSDMTHKGNCRFCAERRKQELKELEEKLNKGPQ